MTAREAADALTWSLARQCRPDDVLVVGVATPLAVVVVQVGCRASDAPADQSGTD